MAGKIHNRGDSMGECTELEKESKDIHELIDAIDDLEFLNRIKNILISHYIT